MNIYDVNASSILQLIGNITCYSTDEQNRTKTALLNAVCEMRF